MAKKKAKKKKTVRVNRDDAIALFRELGFKTATDWDDEKLAKNLNRLEDLPAKMKTKQTERAARLVMSVPKGGVKIAGMEERQEEKDAKNKKEQEAFDKERAQSTEKRKAKVGAGKKSKTGEEDMAKKKAKKKAKKAAKKAAKKKAATKAKANGNGKDKFGTRVGTKGAKFNAALTAKPQTMAVLMKKAGLKETMYNHANKLIENKLVRKSDDGYALAG